MAAPYQTTATATSNTEMLALAGGLRDADGSRVMRAGLQSCACHDHLCLIYETLEQQLAAAVPFIRTGLERGEKCVYIVDGNTAGAIMAAIWESGVDVDAAVKSGALGILARQEAYWKHGRFDPEAMLGFLKEAVAAAEAEGYAGLRFVGEMTWALGGDPGAERLLEYAVQLNEFLAGHHVLAVCLYDRHRFPPETLLEVIHTHPLLIHGDLVCDNPHYIPPEVYLRRKRDPEAEVEHLLGSIARDAQLREALRKSAERLRFMAESMPQKIFQTKGNGEIEYLNRQWIAFTGQSLEQIKSLGWRQLIHPGDLDESVRRWRRSLETGEPFEFVHRIRRADGAYRWHLTRVRAMPDADGISMWVGSSTDVEDEERRQEELRRANDDLNQFAFAAAHDLREPMRTIGAYSRLLSSRYGGQLDPDASQFVDYIAEGTRRMSELLEGLLSYIQAGADGDDPAGFVDLNSVFGNAAQNLQSAIAESGAAVSCDRLPAVRGRQAHFLELFQNLIGNGIKYRSERPPHIHVSVERRNGNWRFAVADNGIGIAPEYRRQIFGVFKRLQGGSIPGAGIGLAICQRVVERHGGRIWVESEPDRGATFYFTLPA